MCSQNPITFLQEFVMKNQLEIPKYSFRQENMKHYCRICFLGKSMECEARSKKLAKTKVATEIMHSLSLKMDDIQLNPVSELKLFVDKYKIEMPTYNYVGEANGKYCTDCIWKKITVNGTGKTKKISKQAAAMLMFPVIQSTLGFPTKTPKNETIVKEENIAKNQNIVSNQDILNDQKNNENIKNEDIVMDQNNILNDEKNILNNPNIANEDVEMDQINILNDQTEILNNQNVKKENIAVKEKNILNDDKNIFNNQNIANEDVEMDQINILNDQTEILNNQNVKKENIAVKEKNILNDQINILDNKTIESEDIAIKMKNILSNKINILDNQTIESEDIAIKKKNVLNDLMNILNNRNVEKEDVEMDQLKIKVLYDLKNILNKHDIFNIDTNFEQYRNEVNNNDTVKDTDIANAQVVAKPEHNLTIVDNKMVEDIKSIKVEIILLEHVMILVDKQYEIKVLSDVAPCVICLTFLEVPKISIVEVGNNIYQTKRNLLKKAIRQNF